ncbi:hypothetical protein RIF29_28521 [Crotalaria pallida]|uniref:Uncharacterized protein n=1 Tax=Crotalaria pallida TaxID=3830 RepID=A0AAN9ED97_CROPI
MLKCQVMDNVQSTKQHNRRIRVGTSQGHIGSVSMRASMLAPPCKNNLGQSKPKFWFSRNERDEGQWLTTVFTFVPVLGSMGGIREQCATMGSRLEF